MGATAVVRGVAFVVGAGMMLGGLATIALGPVLGIPGLWLLGTGGALVVASILERTRYRSEAAERASEPPGPGGGETDDTLEPRFRRTDEVFVDPSSRRRMRVLLDARTGERRYVAEDQGERR
jgi:hypothetical protein